MHYTRKDMARLAGINERTVDKLLERYTQRTGMVRVAPERGPHHWHYSEQDLDWVLAEKQHEAEERARKVQAPYMHATDNTPTSTNLSEILDRLEAIEGQLATLRERASWLFAPVARSEGRQASLGGAEVSSYQPATYKPSGEPLVRSLSLSSLPEGYVPVDRFAQAHGMRDSQRTTWLEAIRDGRLPGHVNMEGWRVVNARGNVTKARYALDAEGRRVFCELWRNAEWFHPCEECPHE